MVVTREVLGIRQKPRRRRRRSIPRARLLGIPVLAGWILILAHLLTAPTYVVDRAAIRGNTLVDAQYIYDASGIDGQNLFLVNPHAVANAVEQLPYIKRAQVRTALPAQVAIVVQEYRPRWVWLAGDNRFWIDETGEVLPDNQMLSEALTVIEQSSRSLPVGSRLDPRLVEMLEMINRLLPELRQISYEEGLGFVLPVGPGWPARVGDDPARLPAIVGILNSLVPELTRQGKDIAFIDLRYPERPYYREK